jgi:hypothetical protein
MGLAASVDVFNTNWRGMHVVAAVVLVQAREGP